MSVQIISDKDKLASELRGSLLTFSRFFYELLTGRRFIVSEPPGRESHHIIISKALTKAARLKLENHRLLINVSPGSGKSTLVSMWIAWCMTIHPDCKFLYISYSKVLSTKNTEFIKRIMQLPQYEYLFDVKIRADSQAKDYFQTEGGGHVYAAGSSGAITGFDAGSPGLSRFSGAIIIDDAHKPDEIFSDTLRGAVIENYSSTIQQRARGVNVPIISIGQRLHEDDLSAHMLEGKDGYDWEKVIIQSIDEAGNPMYPEVQPLDMLLKRKETDPYTYSAQYQQLPTPAGGAVFKPDWFVELDDEPKILYSFIVCDTAETSKTYNDASAFGFFGVYEIETLGIKTGTYGIHWIDALETWVEPKDLKDTFLNFWQQCMRYKCPPKMAAIEKKSSGSALISLLSDIRTIKIVDIQRSSASGSKTKRFLDVQPYVAERLVSLPSFARHTKSCIEHMSKITANDTHRRDDLADTLTDAIRMALIEKSIISAHVSPRDDSETAHELATHFKRIASMKSKAYAR